MDRDAAERRKTMLLLGATDMQQVIEAAVAIQDEHRSATPRLELLRALETAVAVCYWRPFSQNNTIGHLRDGDAEDPTLHAHMKTLRNQAYAHIDASSGRSADIEDIVTPTGVEGLALTEGWWPLPADWLPRIIEVAVRQRDTWRAEAADIRRRLSSSE